MTDQPPNEELVCPECGVAVSPNATVCREQNPVADIIPIPRSEYEGKQRDCKKCSGHKTVRNRVNLEGDGTEEWCENCSTETPSNKILVDRELLEYCLYAARFSAMRCHQIGMFDKHIAQLQALLKKDSDHE